MLLLISYVITNAMSVYTNMELKDHIAFLSTIFNALGTAMYWVELHRTQVTFRLSIYELQFDLLLSKGLKVAIICLLINFLFIGSIAHFHQMAIQKVLIITLREMVTILLFIGTIKILSSSPRFR